MYRPSQEKLLRFLNFFAVCCGYTTIVKKEFFSASQIFCSEFVAVSLRSHKRQAVDLVFLVAHIDARAITFKAVVVVAGLDLAGPDAGDIILEAALGGRLAECVAHRIVQVADRDGQRVAHAIGIVGTFHDFTAFDSCHFHNGTSVKDS